MKGPLEYVGQYRWFNPSFYPSLCPYIHGEKTPPARRPHHDIAQSAPHHYIVSVYLCVVNWVHRRLKPPRRGRKHSWECSALGDIWKSCGSVKYVALSPPAEEEDILAT